LAFLEFCIALRISRNCVLHTRMKAITPNVRGLKYTQWNVCGGYGWTTRIPITHTGYCCFCYGYIAGHTCHIPHPHPHPHPHPVSVAPKRPHKFVFNVTLLTADCALHKPAKIYIHIRIHTTHLSVELAIHSYMAPLANRSMSMGLQLH